MFATFLTRIFGSRNQRILRRYSAVVERANALEQGLKALSDDALRAKTEELRTHLRAGGSLDDLVPEAFAVVREAARRTLGMRHFDVQLIGGLALQGDYFVLEEENQCCKSPPIPCAGFAPAPDRGGDP